jgi:transcriptional regulator with AAA-type ATPase domain
VKAAAAEPTRTELSRRLRREGLIERSFIFEGAFGDNPKLLESLEIAEKAAPTGLPVLIDGETAPARS